MKLSDTKFVTSESNTPTFISSLKISLIFVNAEVKSEFDKEKAKTSKTKVCMNSSPGVNPFLILISGALIKHVHEIDSRENLREQRKELLS